MSDHPNSPATPSLETSLDMRGDVHLCGRCHVIFTSVRGFLDHRIRDCAGQNHWPQQPPQETQGDPTLGQYGGAAGARLNASGPWSAMGGCELDGYLSAVAASADPHQSRSGSMATDGNTGSPYRPTQLIEILCDAGGSPAALEDDPDGLLMADSGGLLDATPPAPPPTQIATPVASHMLDSPGADVTPGSPPVDVQLASSAGQKRKQPVGPRVRHKRHVCSICGYQCAYPKDLQRHMFSHKDESFPCPHCDRVYNRPDKLQSHVRIKHAATARGDQQNVAPRVPCPVPDCQRTSVSAYHMKKHLQNCHSDIRPYSCQICSYRAKHLHRLNLHLRTHTGDAPYRCNVCSKNFKTVGDLKRHKITHTDSKPFKCAACHFSTAYRTNLRVHMRRLHADGATVETETNDTPPAGVTSLARTKPVLARGPKKAAKKRRVKYYPNFQCDQCRMSFVREESHRAHMQTTHQPRRHERHYAAAIEATSIPTDGDETAAGERLPVERGEIALLGAEERQEACESRTADMSVEEFLNW